VTVTAINSVVAGVVLVAELNRLRAVNRNARNIRRAGENRNAVKNYPAQNNQPDNARLSDCVCAAIKNLSHNPKNSSCVFGQAAKRVKISVATQFRFYALIFLETMYQKLQFDNVSKITIRATGFFFKIACLTFKAELHAALELLFFLLMCKFSLN
jgi:hypothetical protein